jgi:hypothetical protein
MSNEDPTRDLAQDLGYDEDLAEARWRDELRAAKREELWRWMVEFLALFTWWA